MKPFLKLAVPVALVTSLTSVGSAKDCLTQSAQIGRDIDATPTRVLELVERGVLESPDCACEITKVAIRSSDGQPELAAAIAEVAMVSAPDKMRLIAQCAIAVAPDALSDIQAALIRLQPSSGEKAVSAKAPASAKGPKQPLPTPPQPPMWNPLDFPAPGDSMGGPVVGPPPGTTDPGGMPILPPLVPIVINPPLITPPIATPTGPTVR